MHGKTPQVFKRGFIMRLNTGFIVLSAGAVLALSSCGKLNDMHDATVDVNKKTDHLSASTDHLKDKTDEIEKATCKMYTSLRQGNAKQSRDADMTAMRASKNINEKLELSAKYMQGFEYQLWTDSCAEVAPRDVVIDQAVTELLTTLEPYVKDRSKVTATKQSDDYQTLYAIAATLHRVNELQDVYLKGTNEKALRPLDILLQGLKYHQMSNRGELGDEVAPSWATIVGKYEKDAEFVLRIRANFMMAYGYAVADSDSFGDAPSTLEKIGRIGMTKLFSSKWKPNLDARDPTEIRERITVSLKLAQETRAGLISLGIDPMIDETVQKIWKDADFAGFDLAKMAKGKGDEPARAKAIRDLISARDALIAN
jgi:hypothetical protein